jgi:hypothetical protein
MVPSPEKRFLCFPPKTVRPPGCCHLVTADDSLEMTCRRYLLGEN